MSTIADRKADLLAFCVVYEALDDIAQVTTDPDELKKLESVMSPYASEACIPFTRV